MTFRIRLELEDNVQASKTVMAEVTKQIEGALDFLRHVITKGITKEHVVKVRVERMAPGLIAWSRIDDTEWSETLQRQVPTAQIITINLEEVPSQMRQCLLNGTPCTKLRIIVIHEVLHGLGMVETEGGWGHLLTADEGTLWYTGGKRAVEEYRKLTGRKKLEGIPVENSFGVGSENCHWEEGGTDETSLKVRGYMLYSGERRFRGGVFHPALTNDIMSGFQDRSEYFSRVTAGALEDLGYGIDWRERGYIVNYPKRLAQKRHLARAIVYFVYNACVDSLKLHVQPPATRLWLFLASSADKLAVRRRIP